MEEKAEAVGPAPATWEHHDSIEFPKELPMEHSYKKQSFYVRPCYLKYYDMVLEFLNRDADAVTITGTAGIGKSVFYAYFFKRYSFENNDTTVITASFEKDKTKSKMKKVVVWINGQVVAQASGDKVQMKEVIRQAEKAASEAKTKVIHLYDGPPTSCPADAPMVCFTNPDETWFAKLDLYPDRPKLFMPVWDRDELQNAAEELELEMDPPVPGVETKDDEEGPKDDAVMVGELLDQRFHLFGGVARDCLSTDASFVQEREAWLENTIGRLVDVSEMLDPNLLRLGLVHYIPDPSNPRKYTTDNASLFVRRSMVQHVSQMFYNWK